MKNTKKQYPLTDSPFRRLRSRRKLAELLGIDRKVLKQLTRRKDLYKEFDIPKGNGASRRVENPARPLKIVQARIARLLGRVVAPNYFFCPVKGRSYVSNAALHRHSRVVRCLDIQKYFPNTPQRRVYWFFHTVMECETDVAATLANLACYNGHLPTGSPLSPIMAFYAYFDIWQEIASIAQTNNCVISVYVDDITVSGHKVSDAVIWEIKRVLHRAGLVYHKEKHFIDQPAEVTGVIIYEGKLCAPRRQHLKLHATRRELQSSSTASADKVLLGRVKGLEGQLRQIQAAELFDANQLENRRLIGTNLV